MSSSFTKDGHLATQTELKLELMFIYETLCPQQMLVHKGGQINNMQLIAGMGSAEMSHLQICSVKISKEHCRYLKKEKKKEEKLKQKNEKKGGVGSW